MCHPENKKRKFVHKFPRKLQPNTNISNFLPFTKDFLLFLFVLDFLRTIKITDIINIKFMLLTMFTLNYIACSRICIFFGNFHSPFFINIILMLFYASKKIKVFFFLFYDKTNHKKNRN